MNRTNEKGETADISAFENEVNESSYSLLLQKQE